MSEPVVAGYAEALAELDQILAELEGHDVDVDLLGVRVRRAAELVALCRDRIARARLDVEQVTARFDAAGSGGESAKADSAQAESAPAGSDQGDTGPGVTV